MKKLLSLSILLLIVYCANAQTQIIKTKKLLEVINSDDAPITVVNFWATWCGPCIKELPFFEEAQREFKEQVSINLVSVDFADKIEKVNKFVMLKNLQSSVWLIDEIDYNSWIDQVDNSWSGAIPATLIVNNTTGHRKFVEHELKEGELKMLIEELLIK